MKPKPHLRTALLHAGWHDDPDGGGGHDSRGGRAVAVPIHQTAAFGFEDAEDAALRFAHARPGHIYSRISNPTVEAFEVRMAALEGGRSAVAFASGQAATLGAILSLARAGDEIVASSHVYGGTLTLLTATLPSMGIEVKFADPRDPEGFLRASGTRTRAWFGETIANPLLSVLPVRRLAALGRGIGVPLLVDNTCAPLIARPLLHGAAAVVHSATKWIGGHGSTIGGVLVDGGFDWAGSSRQLPLLNEPDLGSGGIVWSKLAAERGVGALALRARSRGLCDQGASMAPFTAFLLLQGIETLALRMPVHCEQAGLVARFLERARQVAAVRVPRVQDADDAALLEGGLGGLVGFDLAGGREAASRFLDAVRLVLHVSNIGDCRTLVTHPASTTHAGLGLDQLRELGIGPGFLRLSVGLEHPDDITADLGHALERAEASAGAGHGTLRAVATGG